MQNTTVTQDERGGFSCPQSNVSKGYSISYRIDSDGVVMKLYDSPNNCRSDNYKLDNILDTFYLISFDLRDGGDRLDIKSYFYAGAVHSSSLLGGKQIRKAVPTAARMSRILGGNGTSLPELLKKYIEWQSSGC